MKILFSPDDNLITKIESTDWNVDEIIIPAMFDRYRIPEISDCIIFFVPTIINQNMALNYDGVELAIRLYLQCIRNNKLNIKIILLGIESKQSFMMRYRYPNIMKCPGIDYIMFHQDLIYSYNKCPSILNIETAKQSLNLLGFKLPDSYRSNHSFINEWCFYNWSEYMGYDTSCVHNALQGNLYFEYLRTVQQGIKVAKVSADKIQAFNELKGRILLIDDNPYWHSFFKELFKNSQVQFEAIGKDFKTHQVKEIVRKCEDFIKDFNPDIILLDFRLNEDSDYDVNKRKDISGVKVLEALKGNSENIGCAFGSRVLMFTATGKIDHVLALQDYGADGFIFKEHPQKYVGKASTKESIKKMLILFEEMLSCAPIAKSIIKSFNNWNKYLQTLQKNNDTALKVYQVEKVVRALMHGNFLNTPMLKLIYLETFSILEFKNKSTEDTNPYIKRYASSIGVESNFQAIWDNICDLRNSLAHGDNTVRFKKSIKFKNETKIEINNRLIGDWLQILCDYLSDFLLKDINP